MRCNWLFMVVVACSSPPDTMTSTVGAEGGDVSAGGASLDIPPGALEGDAEITVAAESSDGMPSMPDGADMPDTVTAFLPHGTQFALPVAVTLTYEGDDSGRAVMRLDDESDSDWELVSGATFADGEAKFMTTHFSFYAVVEVDCGSVSSGDGATSTDPAPPADGSPDTSGPTGSGKATRDGCSGDTADGAPTANPGSTGPGGTPSGKAVRSLFQTVCCDGGTSSGGGGDADPTPPADGSTGTGAPTGA